MENRYARWVNLCLVVLSALAGYLFFELFARVGVVLELESKVKSFHLIEQFGSVVVGLLVFALLYRNQRVNVYATDVISELANVTWPTPKDTTASTVVVVGMVVVSGIILGLLDYLWTVLIKWVL